MIPKEVFISKTPAGKPKIIDHNGFSIANAPDATNQSEAIFKRLILSYNIFSSASMDELGEILNNLNK